MTHAALAVPFDWFGKEDVYLSYRGVSAHLRLARNGVGLQFDWLAGDKVVGFRLNYQ